MNSKIILKLRFVTKLVWNYSNKHLIELPVIYLKSVIMNGRRNYKGMKMKSSRRLYRISSLLAMLLTLVQMNGCATNAQSQGENVIRLFNGEDLTNFYTFIEDRGVNSDPESVFTVQNNQIRISGVEWGTLITEEEYENFQLILEFRWGGETYGDRREKARDSGVFVHSIGEEGARGGVWMTGIETNIIEGGTGDFIVVGDGSDKFQVTALAVEDTANNQIIYDPEGQPVTVNSGRINWWGRSLEWEDVKGFRSENDVEKPLGEWNRMELIVTGRHITVILNDVVVNQASQVRPYRGKIQIQSEGAEIFFRRIDLIPLAGS
ncbi:MAG: DUF1080 domain-containing protein [Candidatus Marinimicrobia bacterium]|nr:DUF1080 domain-containing protein [Candidatus Neomarinimicrobiota bacterium]